MLKCAPTALLSLVLVAMPSFAQLSGSDLWLFQLANVEGKVQVQNAKRITDNAEYTNQPHFSADANTLWYTQSVAANGDKAAQTEVFQYSLVNHSHHRFTQTQDSEYSPTPMPTGDGISTIRVDADNKQWLWAYSADAKSLGKLASVEPIGYQVWLSETELLTFVLGEPHTLQRLSTNTGASIAVVDEHIGASLWPIPGSDKYSYTKNPNPDGQVWTVMQYDPASGQSEALATLPQGAYYMAWSVDGQILTATETAIMAFEPNSDTARWYEYIALKPYCQNGASRLHMSSTGDYLAVVCNR